MEGLEKLGVPVGPVNDIGQVFSDPQVLARGMKVQMPHPLAGSGHVDLIGNPIKLSKSPVDYKRPPPTCGQHTDEVLKELLFMEDSELADLKAKGIV
jgi:crotonobetainyl-CoA:carnitine CoA-transferase CaiB-like acyl-CoA transferase